MIEKRLSKSEWRDGWPIVTAGLIGLILSSQHLGPIGVLMTPLNEIFGWSRSQIAAGPLIMTFFVFVFGPAIGLVIPRFGIKRIVLISATILSIGYFTLGLCTANVWSWYFGWIVTSLGFVGVSPLVWTTVITRAFVKHRGFAFSVMLTGTGISAFASPLMTAFALEHFGWRAPFFILAAFSLLVMLPGLWYLMNTRPDFDLRNVEAAQPEAASDDTRRLEKVLKNLRVWQLVLASLLMAAAVGTLITHMQAIMRDFGASMTQAAAYFSAMGPSLIIGRLAAGLMLDRFPVRTIAALLFLLPTLTCILLMHYDGSAFWGVIICVIFGLGFGAETDVLAYLTSRYFSLRDYPLVYSLVYGVFGVSYGASGVLGGIAAEHFGSYEKVLYGLTTGAILAVIMIATLGRPLPREDEISNRREGPAPT